MKMSCLPVILSLLASVSCQSDVSRLTNDYLSRDWEYLGNWKGAFLQQDTLITYFNEDTTSINTLTLGYLVVTDSGTWKFSAANNNGITVAEHQRYLVTFRFENDSVGYLYGLNPSQILFDTLEVNWSNDHLTVYDEPLVDEMTAETIVPAQQGVVEMVTEDTLQIRWDYGIVSKFERVSR